MDEKYLDILSKNILNDVKSYIEHNKIYLEKDKEIEIDKKMLEIIKSIVLNDKKNIFEEKEEEKDKQKEINSNIMPSLIQYYVALYNDNLDLLHKLLDSEFSFGDYKQGQMNVFVLDKSISSKFELDEYIKLTKNNVELFKNFYYSLNHNRDNKEINLNKIIEKFCNVIKKDNNISITKTTFNNRCDRLFTMDFLINFTEEEILNLTDIQKKMLNGFVYNSLSIEQIMSMSDECVDKVNSLCASYELQRLSRRYLESYEKTLERWIKEAYYKDVVTRNVKKLIKR